MGFKKVVKKGFFSGFNVKRWLGTEHIKQNAKIIGGLYSNATQQKEADPKLKTFADYQKHYQLSNEDLAKKQAACKKSALLYSIMALGILVYTVYMIFSGSVLASFVCSMLTLMLVSFAFREHFNAYRIQQRNLKVSYREWFLATFKRQ